MNITVVLTIEDVRVLMNALDFQQRNWRGPEDTWPGWPARVHLEDALIANAERHT